MSKTSEEISDMEVAREGVGQAEGLELGAPLDEVSPYGEEAVSVRRWWRGESEGVELSVMQRKNGAACRVRLTYVEAHLLAAGLVDPSLGIRPDELEGYEAWLEGDAQSFGLRLQNPRLYDRVRADAALAEALNARATAELDRQQVRPA